ncbi:hypothetical protein ACE6H2_024256 [Prunus campanulata]
MNSRPRLIAHFVEPSLCCCYKEAYSVVKKEWRGIQQLGKCARKAELTHTSKNILMKFVSN